MAYAIAVVNGTLNTGTGTQSFTKSGFGTPTAAVFMVSKTTTDTTSTVDAVGAVGFTDGTNDYVTSWSSEDGADPTVCFDRSSDSHCVMLINETDGTVLGSASFNAWVTDGVQINIDDAFGTAYRISVVLIFAEDAQVGTVTINASVSGTTSITGLSGTPDFIITSHIGRTTGDANGTDARAAMGFGANASGGTEQRANCWLRLDAQGSADNYNGNRTDAVAVNITSSAFDWWAELTSWNSDGVTLTTRNAAGGDVVGYLLVKGFEVDTQINEPAGAGSQTYSGFDFQPEGLFIVNRAQLPAADDIHTGTSFYASIVGFGCGAGTVDADQGSISLRDRDQNAIADTQNFWTDSAWSTYRYSDPTTAYTGKITAFTSDGITFNHSADTTLLGAAMMMAFKGRAEAAAAGHQVFKKHAFQNHMLRR